MSSRSPYLAPSSSFAYNANMKKFFTILSAATFILLSVQVALAQSPKAILSSDPLLVATESGESTPSGITKLTEKKPDITEPEGAVKSKLQQLLDGQSLEPLNYSNFLRHAIHRAVSQGVPPNTIVLVLLFPVVAAIIAASRHLLGLRGFGIFTPAVLSVAFVATGLLSGILIFSVILLVATLSKFILKRLKLQYLPRMALLLWFVSLGVLALMFTSTYLNLEAITKLNIFPILILVPG